MLSIQERALQAARRISDRSLGGYALHTAEYALRTLLLDLQQEIEGLDIQEDLDRPGWPLLNRSEVLALIAGAAEIIGAPQL